MRTLLHFRAGSRLRAQMERAPDWLRVSPVDEEDENGFAALWPQTEVLWHVLKPVTAEMIAAAPRLRLIQKWGVGVNTIDLEAARERGVAVANMPGVNSPAVAELTLGLMLATLRKVLLLDAAVRAGRGWPLPTDMLDHVGELAGRTVGFVGFGAVPRRLAPILEALGARVIYTSRTAYPDASYEFHTLTQLLGTADIVSLHAPLTPDTQDMIDAGAIAAMKPGAILINTARGGLVDEAALCAALVAGRLAGAGLDVLAVEPARSAHRLHALENVVITPHVAWLTPETLARCLGFAVANCERLRAGQALQSQVI